MKKIACLFAAMCLVGCTGQGTSGEVVGAAASLSDGGVFDPMSGAGRGSQNYQFQGTAADANFYGYSADGCASWSGAIYGGETVAHVVHGRPQSSAYTYAYLYGYNYCTGENFGGWGSTEAAAIDNLSSAELSVPITVSSMSCQWVECVPESTDPRCAAPPTCDPMSDPYCRPPCDPRRDPWCCDPALDPTCVPPPPPPPPVGYMDCTYVEQTGDFVATIVGEGDVTRGISMSNYSSGTYRSVYRNNGSWRSASATASLLIGGRNLLAGTVGYGTLSDNTISSHTSYRY